MSRRRAATVVYRGLEVSVKATSGSCSSRDISICAVHASGCLVIIRSVLFMLLAVKNLPARPGELCGGALRCEFRDEDENSGFEKKQVAVHRHRDGHRRPRGVRWLRCRRRDLGAVAALPRRPQGRPAGRHRGSTMCRLSLRPCCPLSRDNSICAVLCF